MLARRFGQLVQAALATGALVVPACGGDSRGGDHFSDLGGRGGAEDAGGSAGTKSTASGGSGGSGGKATGGSAGSAAGGDTTGAGGDPSGSGGDTTGTGGDPSGSGGDTTGAGGDPSGSGGAAGDGGEAGEIGTGGVPASDTDPPELVSATLAANGATLTLTFQDGEDLAELQGVDPEKFRLSYGYVYASRGHSNATCDASGCYWYSYAYFYTSYFEVGDFNGGGDRVISALTLTAENEITAVVDPALDVSELCDDFADDTGKQPGLFLHFTDELLTGTASVKDEADHALAAIAEDWVISGENQAYYYFGYDWCTATCAGGASCVPAPCTIPTPSGAFAAGALKVSVTCD